MDKQQSNDRICIGSVDELRTLGLIVPGLDTAASPDDRIFIGLDQATKIVRNIMTLWEIEPQTQDKILAHGDYADAISDVVEIYKACRVLELLSILVFSMMNQAAT